MPFGDRTGPFGQGPRTGRGAGFCGGAGAPGNVNGPGRGFGRRNRGGGGRGARNCFYATGLPGWQRAEFGFHAGMPQASASAVSEQQEVQELRMQAEVLQRTLLEIQQRLDAVEGKQKQG